MVAVEGGGEGVLVWRRQGRSPHRRGQGPFYAPQRLGPSGGRAAAAAAPTAAAVAHAQPPARHARHSYRGGGGRAAGTNPLARREAP